MRTLSRWRSNLGQVRLQSARWREAWAVERELERAVSGNAPIIVGPWISEVGYEILYWIPFLRWVVTAYRVPRHRVVAMSRGGVESWYGGIASRYVECFDYLQPAELRARAAAGQLKQGEQSSFDRQLVEQARRRMDLGDGTTVLHPSLMFRWFEPFRFGHQTLEFVEQHTTFAPVDPPDVEVPVALPPKYAAVKFYAARSLPDQPVVRAQLRAVVDRLSERMPVVSLDTGLGFDEHADYAHSQESRVVSVSGHLDARTNLGVQTRIVAGAKLFVGTCGGLAWLAPLLGVPTVPVFSDLSILHSHLYVARRAYGRISAAPFSPIDLTGITDQDLAMVAQHAGAAVGRLMALPTG